MKKNYRYYTDGYFLLLADPKNKRTSKNILSIKKKSVYRNSSPVS